MKTDWTFVGILLACAIGSPFVLAFLLGVLALLVLLAWGLVPGWVIWVLFARRPLIEVNGVIKATPQPREGR